MQHIGWLKSGKEIKLRLGWLKNGKELDSAISFLFDGLTTIKLGKNTMKINEFKDYLKSEPEHTETIKIEMYNTRNQKLTNYIHIRRAPGAGTHFMTNDDYLRPIKTNSYLDIKNLDIKRSYEVDFGHMFSHLMLGDGTYSISNKLLKPFNYMMKDKQLCSSLKPLYQENYEHGRTNDNFDNLYDITGIYGTKEIFIFNAIGTVENSKKAYLMSSIGSYEIPYNMFQKGSKNKIFDMLNIEYNGLKNTRGNNYSKDTIYNKIAEKLILRDIE